MGFGFCILYLGVSLRSKVVGHCGLEPQTPVLSGLCSNQLS
jgi:hypothetical protein